MSWYRSQSTSTASTTKGIVHATRLRTLGGFGERRALWLPPRQRLRLRLFLVMIVAGMIVIMSLVVAVSLAFAVSDTAKLGSFADP